MFSNICQKVFFFCGEFSVNLLNPNKQKKSEELIKHDVHYARSSKNDQTQ